MCDELHRGCRLRERSVLQHIDPPVRAERGNGDDLRWDRDAVHEHQLREPGLLRERDLRRLRVRGRGVREHVRERLELRERLLLQHGDQPLRAERGRGRGVFGKRRPVRQR